MPIVGNKVRIAVWIGGEGQRAITKAGNLMQEVKTGRRVRAVTVQMSMHKIKNKEL